MEEIIAIVTTRSVSCIIFIQKSLTLGRFLALQNHITKYLGHPQDVGRTCLLPLTYQTIWGSPYNICRRRAQDVGRGRLFVLHVGQQGDILRTLDQDVHRTSYFNVIRTSVDDVLRILGDNIPWRYIEDVILPSGQYTSGHFSTSFSIGIPAYIVRNNFLAEPRCLKTFYKLAVPPTERKVVSSFNFQLPQNKRGIIAVDTGKVCYPGGFLSAGQRPLSWRCHVDIKV